MNSVWFMQSFLAAFFPDEVQKRPPACAPLPPTTRTQFHMSACARCFLSGNLSAKET